MKQRTFIISNKQVIDSLVEFLNTWPCEDGPWEVTVKPYKKDRTVQQNSLLWLWQTVIADELGMTKEEVHENLKSRILTRIFERDDEGYCKMVNNLRKLYTQGFKTEAKELHKQVVRLTSTTAANTSQFAEYLTEIERDMANKGISLPHPEDRYIDALMITR